MSDAPLIQFEKVAKKFLRNEPIFRDISLKINRGEFLFLTGVSGAGKSTIFRILLGLEQPDSGRVWFNGSEVRKISKGKMHRHRRLIGMIFQDYKLLEKKTAAENIVIPLQISGTPASQRQIKMKEITQQLEIEHLLHQPVQSLSGGEQQLIAVARAAIHHPLVILADEPTANLDPRMANRIFKMLTLLNASGITVVIATHDVNLIKSYQKRTLLLRNKGLVEVR